MSAKPMTAFNFFYWETLLTGSGGGPKILLLLNLIAGIRLAYVFPGIGTFLASIAISLYGNNDFNFILNPKVLKTIIWKCIIKREC